MNHDNKTCEKPLITPENNDKTKYKININKEIGLLSRKILSSKYKKISSGLQINKINYCNPIDLFPLMTLRIEKKSSFNYATQTENLSVRHAYTTLSTDTAREKFSSHRKLINIKKKKIDQFKDKSHKAKSNKTISLNLKDKNDILISDSEQTSTISGNLKYFPNYPKKYLLKSVIRKLLSSKVKNNNLI